MGAIYKNGISYSGGGGGGTGETPTLEQVLTKGNSTTNTIDFSASGNDDTSVSGSGMYATGTGTEGMRQVVYNQHGISAVDNLVGTITDIFKVDFDNEQVAMSDGVKEAFKTALDLDEIFYIPVDEDDLTPSTVQPQGVKEGILTTPYTIEEIWAQHTAGKLCAVLLTNTTDGNKDRFLPLEFNGDPQVVGAQAWNESLYYDYASGQVIEPTPKALVVSIVKQTSDTKVYVTRTDMQGTGGVVDQSYDPTSTHAQSGTAVAAAVGDLSSLATSAQDNLVNAVNELKSDVSALGEPFRVKQWGSNTLNVEIPYCTEDIANGSIPKMVFSIDDVEGADYQIVGMVAYEVFDAASGGNRINCWPVCQFTGNGQKELSVRWMGGGTTRKTAKRINAWVLLKHR